MTDRTGDKPGLGYWGASYVRRMAGTVMAPPVVFFVVSWRLDIVQAWVYFGLFVLLALSNSGTTPRRYASSKSGSTRVICPFTESISVRIPKGTMFCGSVCPASKSRTIGMSSRPNS